VPDPLVLAVFVAGTFLMRSAGCAINDYADRDIDPHVARTSERPLAAGLVSPREALYVAGGLSLVAFGLVLLMNTLTILLSVVGLLLAATYPFAKRYTHLPQVHLGAAFGWAVPMAFAAQANALPPTAWLLYLAAILWATIYDTMYAMADRPEDLKIGVKSTAILFGDADLFILAVLQGLFTITLAVVGHQAGLGWPFAIGLMTAVGFMVYHQRLIADREAPHLDPLGTRRDQLARQLGHGVPGRDDVVDQRHAPPGHSRIDLERPPDVAPPCRRIQAALRGGVTQPTRGMGAQRRIEPPRDRPRQLSRLVVAAHAQPAWVQRHRDHHFRWRGSDRLQMGHEQLAEQPRMTETAGELQLLHQAIERWRVEIGGARRREGRPAPAASACRAPRAGRQRQRADRAGVPDAGQCVGTGVTQVARAIATTAAEQAARREERELYIIYTSVYQGDPSRLTAASCRLPCAPAQSLWAQPR
jgi:4-hydroxybenzoate polyprenyltransferase